MGIFPVVFSSVNDIEKLIDKIIDEGSELSYGLSDIAESSKDIDELFCNDQETDNLLNRIRAEEVQLISLLSDNE